MSMLYMPDYVINGVNKCDEITLHCGNKGMDE